MRFSFATFIATALALPSTALAASASLEDLVTGGGVLAGGNALFGEFTFSGGSGFDGIIVNTIESGDTVGLRFFTPEASANNSEYLVGGSFTVSVFDPTKQIVETRLSIETALDLTSFDPQVTVTTDLLRARDSRAVSNTFDSAPVSSPLPFNKNWFVSVTDSGSMSGFSSGADLFAFEVEYVLGDRPDIAAVPLPASATLLIAGLAGFGALRHRESRSSN